MTTAHRCQAERDGERCTRAARYVVRQERAAYGIEPEWLSCSAHAAESKSEGCRIARLPGRAIDNASRSTAQMLLRLDPDTAATIRAYAAMRQCTLAEVVTEAVDSLVGSDDD